MVEHIRGRAVGSAVPGINLGILKSLPVVLPPLATQKRIAATLNAYDHLIENNTRRIQILVEMARAIYREWFVEYRFPGHEDVPLVDSDLGRIPEDWEVAAVSDVATIVRGRSYRKAETPESGGVPFLNLKCIERGGGFRKSGLKRYTGKFKPSQEARPGDIVVAVTDMTQERNVVAQAARVPTLGEEFGVISLDLARIVPDGLDPTFLYGMFRYSEFSDVVKNYANGANVLHLSPDRIAEHRFVRPAPVVERAFVDRVEPMYQLIDHLQLQNENLRATRDLLLPRLISGEVDVSDLDIDVGDAAA
jgi:type I restriction enzyme S subunit